MTFIVLHDPIASSPRLERVHMFPGRHLGEEEFERAQDYADARLAPLLKTAHKGIVFGLELNLDSNRLDAVFSVNPGLAVAANGRTLGLYNPLRVEWQTLIDDYLSSSLSTDASGVYYLILQQSENTIDSPTVEPCQRAEFDPSRDSRLVTVGSLGLKRLAIDPSAISSMQQEQLENWVAADRVDADFLAGMPNAVPLALLAILPNSSGFFSVQWGSQEAGRYEASANSGYQVLLNQTSAALRQVMQEAALEENSAIPLEDFLQTNLHLDYLPAAGQLPLAWLAEPASRTPSVLWLPDHLGIDMVPVAEESVLELIQRHIARRVIDLRQPAGDRIRLLLAVDETDYRHDLLDIPPTDARLEADIYRFYMRAYGAWLRWHKQFDLLYFVEPSNQPPLSDPTLAEIEHRVLDPSQFKNLDLPKPTLPPVTPLDFFLSIVTRANGELQDPSNPGAPYPYNKPPPTRPAYYTDWLVDVGGNLAPPPVPTPDQDGLVIQYAVALVELESIENQIRAIRTRLEKTRDYLLLQRQQLDSQTVALSALAGGVAGDGGGMQVARWLPYTSLDTSLVDQHISSPAATSSSIKPAFTATAGISASPSISSNISSKYSQNLLSSALASSTSSHSSFLASKPQTFSAFELGINKKRLDMLANLAKESVSRPAFEAKEFRFGVIDHISPEINEYDKAYYGMQDLLATLSNLFLATDASSLRKKLKAVIKADALVDPKILEDEITAKTDALQKRTTDDKFNYNSIRALIASQLRYGALFKAGKVLTQWIAIMEARYNGLERKLQGKLRQHTAKLAQIEKLSALIRVARETLESFDRFFDEQLGDYGVAQRLLEEDWRKAYTDNLERARILTSALRGLYYVRVRGTPISAPLPDPLSLRYASSTDIVPGCSWDEDVDLPDELESFFNAVTEIPMDDWVVLRPLRAKLPPFQRFDFLNQMRQSRFKARPLQVLTTSNTDTLQARLQTLSQQTQIVMQQWSQFSLPTFTASSLQTQEQASRVLSLEDLSNGAAGALRKQAQALRENLEQCQACLLDKLNLLPPSIRLQWGQLAEDDRIRVEDVSWWPGLERAEQDDFNATRSIAELISWWFRQQSPDASAVGRSAMRNMIRSSLIFASLGDPKEIVRGRVHVPPRLPAIGERLKVKLNRAPATGTRLQLLDTSHQMVAILAVEDNSPQSTQVKIVELMQPLAKINTGFSVVGNRRNKKLY